MGIVRTGFLGCDAVCCVCIVLTCAPVTFCEQARLAEEELRRAEAELKIAVAAVHAEVSYSAVLVWFLRMLLCAEGRCCLFFLFALVVAGCCRVCVSIFFVLLGSSCCLTGKEN